MYLNVFTHTLFKKKAHVVLLFVFFSVMAKVKHGEAFRNLGRERPQAAPPSPYTIVC